MKFQTAFRGVWTFLWHYSVGAPWCMAVLFFYSPWYTAFELHFNLQTPGSLLVRRFELFWQIKVFIILFDEKQFQYWIPDQLRFVWNFFLEKFFSISKSVCPKFSKKSSLIFNNKDFHNLIKKMFYQTRRHAFLLYYLTFVWVKFYVSIMRFTQLGAPQS